MAEDLTDDWWQGAEKKFEVEEEEEKPSTAEKKKRRKKRKFEEIVDSNVMSSEDQVKEQLSELLGTVEKEEVAEWIDTAKIRLDPDQPWEEFLNEHSIKLKVTFFVIYFLV